MSLDRLAEFDGGTRQLPDASRDNRGSSSLCHRIALVECESREGRRNVIRAWLSLSGAAEIALQVRNDCRMFRTLEKIGTVRSASTISYGIISYLLYAADRS